MTTATAVSSLSTQACMCSCETQCSCIGLETFRKLAMPNITADLFWGNAVWGAGYFVVRPPEYPTYPPVCWPGPQYASGEKCEYQPDGTFHCDHGTHGTWVPDSSGSPPDPATAIYNVDGTYVTPAGGRGTWTHADGTVPATDHTGFHCWANGATTFQCSDGSTGTFGLPQGSTTTSGVAAGSVAAGSSGIGATGIGSTGSTGYGPPAQASCSYDHANGTYTCTDGTIGTFTPAAQPPPVGSAPSMPPVVTNPQVRCISMQNGSFICDDGTFGAPFGAGPFTSSGGASSGGVASAASGPSSECQWLPNGTYYCPDGSYGHWFPPYAGDQMTSPGGSYGGGGASTDAGSYGAPVIGSYPVGGPAGYASDPSIGYAGCTFNSDYTFTCENGASGEWVPTYQGGEVPDISTTDCIHNPDGTFSCSNGDYGYYVPTIPQASTPPSPPPSSNCTYYPDGTMVCSDGSTGYWTAPPNSAGASPPYYDPLSGAPTIPPSDPTTSPPTYDPLSSVPRPMPDLSGCQLHSTSPLEPTVWICPTGEIGTITPPVHTVTTPEGTRVVAPTLTQRGPGAATPQPRPAGTPPGNLFATPDPAATYTPVPTPGLPSIPFPTSTPTPPPSATGLPAYPSPTPTLTPTLWSQDYETSAVVRCVFDSNGTYICTDGITGTWIPDGLSLNSSAPPNTTNCNFLQDGTYSCTSPVEGQANLTGRWKNNPIRQSVAPFNGVNPLDFGTGCLFFSDGTFACPRNEAEEDFDQYQYQTGYWHKSPNHGNCYFFADGQYRCDNGTYGEYRTKRDDDFNPILYQENRNNNNVQDCTYITGDYGAFDFTGFDPKDGNYQGGYYTRGNPENRDYSGRNGVFVCDIKTVGESGGAVQVEANGGTMSEQITAAGTGVKYMQNDHDFDKKVFYRATLDNEDGTQENCVLIRKNSGTTSGSPDAAEWACGEDAKLMGTWDNVLGIPLAGPSMESCEFREDGIFVCQDGSSGTWLQSSEEYYKNWLENPQTEFENFVPSSRLVPEPTAAPPTPTYAVPTPYEDGTVHLTPTPTITPNVEPGSVEILPTPTPEEGTPVPPDAPAPDPFVDIPDPNLPPTPPPEPTPTPTPF